MSAPQRDESYVHVGLEEMHSRRMPALCPEAWSNDGRHDRLRSQDRRVGGPQQYVTGSKLGQMLSCRM